MRIGVGLFDTMRRMPGAKVPFTLASELVPARLNAYGMTVEPATVLTPPCTSKVYPPALLTIAVGPVPVTVNESVTTMWSERSRPNGLFTSSRGIGRPLVP